jgi:hypothetical protein
MMREILVGILILLIAGCAAETPVAEQPEEQLPKKSEVKEQPPMMTESDCKEDQYLKAGRCVTYACNDNDDCREENPDAECARAGTEWATCVTPEMITITEDECSYDEDCDDNDPSTSDVCEIVGEYTICFNDGSSSLESPKEPSTAAPEMAAPETLDPKPSAPMKSCSDMGCLISASEECAPAKLTWENTVSMFGMLTESVTLMELRGPEGDRCRYYQRTESMQVSFDAETRQAMLDEGKTEEEIGQTEETANINAQSAVGMERSCLFGNPDLTAVLERWKEGKMSSRDFDAAECD